MDATLSTAVPTSAPGTGAVPTSAATAVASPYPASSSGALRPLGGGLLLAALAVAAIVMARRRRRAPRLVEIVESASLGPKRSLVVARMGDELLLLGASEGGITLLSSRAAPSAMAAAAGTEGAAEASASVRGDVVAPLREPDRDPAPALTAVSGLVSRLRRRDEATDDFDRVLTESVEDVELRRKLAAGHAGSIR